MRIYNDPNQYNNFRNGFIDDIKNLIISYAVAPIVIMSGVMVIPILILLAFSPAAVFGPFGKMMVAIGCPAVIIGCIVSKTFGNLLAGLWCLILYICLWLLPLCCVVYIGFKSYFTFLFS